MRTKSSWEHLVTMWGLRTRVSVITCKRSTVMPMMMVHSSSVSVPSIDMKPSEPDEELEDEELEDDEQLEDDEEDELDSLAAGDWDESDDISSIGLSFQVIYNV